MSYYCTGWTRNIHIGNGDTIQDLLNDCACSYNTTITAYLGRDGTIEDTGDDYNDVYCSEHDLADDVNNIYRATLDELTRRDNIFICTNEDHDEYDTPVYNSADALAEHVRIEHEDTAPTETNAPLPAGTTAGTTTCPYPHRPITPEQRTAVQTFLRDYDHERRHATYRTILVPPQIPGTGIMWDQHEPAEAFRLFGRTWHDHIYLAIDDPCINANPSSTHARWVA